MFLEDRPAFSSVCCATEAAINLPIAPHIRTDCATCHCFACRCDALLQVLNGGFPPESMNAVNGNSGASGAQPATPPSAITFADPAVGGPSVLFFMGANGMGKTTTVGKVASRLREEGGQKVLLAAADTFRYRAPMMLLPPLSFSGVYRFLRIASFNHS